MANQNFEKLLEYIVNGEQEKAEELFHALVVNKSREIYEGLFEEEMEDVDMEEAKKCDDEKMEEDAEEKEEESVEEAFIAFSEEPGMGGAMGGNPDPMDDFMDQDVAADGGEDDMDDMGGDDHDDMGGEGDIEDRVMDLEDALEDLKAEFDALMADEKNEPEHHNDDGTDPDFGGDDEEGDEEGEEGEGEEEEEMESFNFEDLEELDLSPVEQMREYVEKVAEPYKGGKAASTSEPAGTNTKSTVAGPNRMGGTSKNIAQGGVGSEKGTAGGLLNPTTKDMNTKNVNFPGTKKATTLHAQTKGHGAEKKGAPEDAQNTKSLLKPQKG